MRGASQCTFFLAASWGVLLYFSNEILVVFFYFTSTLLHHKGANPLYVGLVYGHA